MPVCDACGSDIDAELPFRCNHCSGTFCTDCQLPENHRCPGLTVTDTRARNFRSLLPSISAVLGGDDDDLDDERDGSDEPSITESTAERQPRTTETRRKSTKEPPRPEYEGAKYKPSAPSPDVNPDGSVAGQPTGRSSRGIGTIVLSLLLTPIRFLQSIPGYLRRFNRWLTRLFGATWGLVKTVTPAVVILIGVLFVAGLVGTGVPMIDETANAGAGAIDDFASPSYAEDESELRSEIHREINTVRSERGLEPLQLNSDVSGVAKSHSEDMYEYNFFSHYNQDGQNPVDRLQEENVQCLTPAENLAYREDYTSPQSAAKDIVSQLMDSSSHRENILSEQYRSEGIGVEIRGSSVWVTQMFCA